MCHKMRHPWFNFAPIKEIITMKIIKSPEEVAFLMENIWLRHKAGMKQRPDNVFIVDFPPLTEEEIEEIQRQESISNRADDTPEELFGGWI